MDINSERLKTLRDEKLWSQDELAIASGLSLRTIQRAEREGVASLQTVKAIAAALSIDINLIRRDSHERATEVQPSEEAQRSLSEAPRLGRTVGFALVFSAFVAAALVAWYRGNQEQSPAAVDTAQADKSTNIQANAQADIQASTLATTPVNDQPDIKPAIRSAPEAIKPTSANDLSAKLRGHWESISTGVVMTVDIDATTTRFGGEGKGSSSYTLLKDVISYGFGNRVISAHIRMDSPSEMTWTTLETDTVFKWTRNKIVPPSRDELLAQLQGNWRGRGFVRSLEVDAGKLKLVFMDESRIDSAYLINQQRISFNRAGRMQEYIVSFDSPTEMTWSRTFSPERYAFVRIPPRTD